MGEKEKKEKVKKEKETKKQHKENQHKELITRKDNNFLRGAKNKNSSSTPITNESSNTFNIIPIDDNKATKGMNMQQQHNHDLMIKKQHRFIKSWQHPQSVTSHVPAVLSKLPTTKHRYHSSSASTSRRLDSLWNLVGSAIPGAASGDRFGHSVSMSADGMTVAVGAFVLTSQI